MNIEQERAEFEEWAKCRGMTLHKASPCDGSPPYYLDTASIAAWEGYQAGRAALQSQGREDAARLDWLQQSDGRFFKLLHITSIVDRGFSPTTSSDKWFSSLREAIDHARQAEENK